MAKILISNFLNKFDYKYVEHEKAFIVKLDFSLQMIIDLTDPNKIKIESHLKGSNFLTWPISMSLKGSMIYNFTGLIVCAILFIFLRNEYNTYILTILFVGAIFLVLFWLIYYVTIAESFKRQIIDLTK